MVVIDNGAFEMQVRTKRTGDRGLGTVFSAASAKEQGTAVVEGKINNRGKTFMAFWQIFPVKFSQSKLR